MSEYEITLTIEIKVANFTTFDSPELHKLSLRANKIKA